jgi:hypothetical protein
MSPELALFLANTVSGIHLAIIAYFLIGWLIPFTDLKYRVLAVVVLGSSFILFRFWGGCPLTVLEQLLRQSANAEVNIGQSFIQTYSLKAGLSINENLLDILSFNLSLIVPIIASLFYVTRVFFRRK